MHWPNVDWGLPRTADDRLILTALTVLEQVNGGPSEQEDES